ncbi:MAG TPA: RNA polymerase sigma factor [Chthoniobacteraceae bacterium]|jgi:RNA polymerase sigma-70 factor (ECF subfamily)|nr:RNA polymerase sigma factor [Chthoniobacteraceae bacterium]
MVLPSELIDQVSAFHADAFGWAVACSGGDFESAADTLQECYVKVATGRAKFAGRSSLKTWWLAVVRLTTLEQRRGRQRWQRRAEAVREWLATFGEAAVESPAPDLPAPVGAEELAAALGRLPARQAEIMSLVFQHGLSLSEAATVMGVSVGSARQHYERAKKRLRTLLSAEARTPTGNHAS